MLLDEAADKARRTYDAAADHYDDPALSFWPRMGQRTVDRLALPAGATVLDTPCGSGASALPAARAVGPRGAVIAADISAGLVELARVKAEREGLANITFRLSDMRELGYPDGSFDVVVSVFGIFFVEDMTGMAREFWRMVRPGGVLAVTTWGRGAFDPGAAAFWDAVGEVRPDLVRGFNPWDQLVTEELVLELLESAGIAGATAEAEHSEHALAGPDDWWSVILGSGYRNTVEALSREDREHVERRTREAVRDAPAMLTPAIFASAIKPA